MNKISSSPLINQFSRVPARTPSVSQGPVETFELSPKSEPLIGSQPLAGGSPASPGKVSWFHRVTGGAAGMGAGFLLGAAVVGGPVGVAVGAGAGLIAGVVASGLRNSSSQHTSKLHQLSAGLTGLVAGGVGGMAIGDMIYHAQTSLSSVSLMGGTLVGAAVGALALGIASRFFPNK